MSIVAMLQKEFKFVSQSDHDWRGFWCDGGWLLYDWFGEVSRFCPDCWLNQSVNLSIFLKWTRTKPNFLRRMCIKSAAISGFRKLPCFLRWAQQEAVHWPNFMTILGYFFCYMEFKANFYPVSEPMCTDVSKTHIISFLYFYLSAQTWGSGPAKGCRI